MTEKEQKLIKDLGKCDFRPMHAYFVEVRIEFLCNEDSNTVELRSSGSKGVGNLSPTDLTFGPQISFSLILYIGYNIFWQKRMKLIGPIKFVRAKFYCTYFGTLPN